MIRHPQDAPAVTLRPYYLWMVRGGSETLPFADQCAAACLIDLFDQWHNIAGPGWFKTTLLTIYDAMEGLVGQKAVSDGLRLLVALGLLDSRRNPDNPMDRTYQYRLNEPEVQKRISCWEQDHRLKNAAPRIIPPLMRDYVEAREEMRHVALHHTTEVHMRVSSDSLNSSDLDLLEHDKYFSEYDPVMVRIIQLLCLETFPVVGKSPSPVVPDGKLWEWAKHRLGRPERHMATAYAWKVATGYAMLPLKGDTLVFLDIDHEPFERDVLALLPRLRETYKQQRGNHSCYSFRLPSELARRWQISGPDGEVASLRGSNSYQVGPGSLHPTGQRYTANMLPAIDLSEVETRMLLALFEERRAKQVGRAMHVSPVGPPPKYRAKSANMEQRVRAWGRKAIREEIADLIGKSSGRNTALFWAAHNSARLVLSSGYGYQELHNMLLQAAENNGYVAKDGQRAASSTIRSGYNIGYGKPQRLPKFASEAS